MLADDGAHARVGDHELDSDRPAARHGGHIEGLVVDPTDDETEGLGGKNGEEQERKSEMGKIDKNLGDGVERAADVEDALWVAWDALGDHDTST